MHRLHRHMNCSSKLYPNIHRLLSFNRSSISLIVTVAAVMTDSAQYRAAQYRAAQRHEQVYFVRKRRTSGAVVVLIVRNPYDFFSEFQPYFLRRRGKLFQAGNSEAGPHFH